MNAEHVFVQLGVTVTMVVLAIGWLRSQCKPKRGSAEDDFDLLSSNDEIDEDQGVNDQNDVIAGGVHKRRQLLRTRPTLVYGLFNLGNTCFFNSVIQSLAALPSLRLYLLQRSAETLTHSSPVTIALLEITEVLNTPLKSRKAITPTSLLRALATKSRLINSDQQDAQELFQVVSSSISAEEENGKRQPPISLLDAVAKTRHIAPLDGSSLYLLSSRFGPWNTNPLTGLLASRLSCVQCGYTAALRHFTFDNLSLSLPLQKTCTLADALSLFVSIEHISDANCRRCALSAALPRLRAEQGSILTKLLTCKDKIKALRNTARKQVDKLEHEAVPTMRTRTTRHHAQVEKYEKNVTELTQQLNESRLHQSRVQDMLAGNIEDELLPSMKLPRAETQHTKQLMIAKAPQILALHLNRSSVVRHSIVKNTCRVDFPEVLDLAPFCTNGFMSMSPLESISSPDYHSKHGLPIQPRSTNYLYKSRHEDCDATSSTVHTTSTLNTNLNATLSKRKINKQSTETSAKCQVDIKSTLNVTFSDQLSEKVFPIDERLTELESQASSPTAIHVNSKSNGYVKQSIASSEKQDDKWQPETHRSSPNTRYRLQALVVHYGRHEYGHYVAYRRGPAPVTTRETISRIAVDRQRCNASSQTRHTIHSTDGFLLHSQLSTTSTSSPFNHSQTARSNGQPTALPNCKDASSANNSPQQNCVTENLIDQLSQQFGWLRISDDTVDAMSGPEVPQAEQGAYMLFYEQIE